MKNVILLVLTASLLMIACKKKSTTTPPPATTTSSTPTTPTYFFSYTDSSLVKNYECFSYSFNTYAIVTPPHKISFSNYRTGYSFAIILPYDSTSMINVSKNKRFLIKAYSHVGGYSHPISALGCIELRPTSSNGDSFLDETDTLAYYNKIISIAYNGRSYNSFSMEMEAHWIITGEFKARVYNGATSSNRIWTNGNYKMIVKSNTM